MADLVIVPADVKISGASASVITSLAAEAIIAGQVVYLDDDTRSYFVADSSTAVTALMAGVAITSCATGEYFLLQISNTYMVGAAVVKGTPYYLSDTPDVGAICVHADLASADLVTLIGHAVSTTEIELDITPTGIVIT